MLPYRLAAVDLDDTLLGPDKEISAANHAAIHRLLNAGVKVVLASGRRHENMRRYHKQLDLPDSLIVSCNGAMVMDDRSGEVLHERLLPADLAAAIIEEGERRRATQQFYHLRGALYVNHKNEWTRLYETRTQNNLVLCPDISGLADEPLLKILWVMPPADVLAHFPALRERFADSLYVTITDPEYLEFMAIGVNKAAGIALAAERYGVAPAEVITFGDGNNDVEMLEWAGLGIAMDHAREAAHRAADRVAPPGDPETGFARAVDMLFS